MQNLIRAIAVTFCLIALLPQAQAASKGKPKAAQQVQKERLVLMPLRVGDELQSMQGAMESALVDGLQQKYTVMWGEEVEKKAKEVFRKENQKHDCNEERCMQGIAEAFQSELLATANVTKQEGGYVVILTIQNIFDHVVVFTRPLQCKGCDSFAVVDKLKELGVAAAPVATTPVLAAAEPPQPKVNQNDPDAVLWVEAQKGNTVEDFQVYLDTYPKGKHVPFAKARIKKLKEEAQAAAEQLEQQAWGAAQQGGSEGSYAQYLKAYPTGHFAGLAKVRLDKLKNDVAAREEAELWQKVKEGEHGRIGIQIQPVTKDLASSMGLSKPEGALVSGVEKAGPADLAGIMTGDVIRQYAGKLLNNSSDLPPLVAATEPGSKVFFDLWRKGENLQISVVIGKTNGNIKDLQAYLDKYSNGSHAIEAQSKIDAIRNAEPKVTPAKIGSVITTKSESVVRMGITVAELSKEQLSELKISAGLLVKEVTLPSLRAVLMQNDLLLAIGNMEITSIEQLNEILGKLPSGRNVALLIRRGDAASYVAIKLDEK
jgi:hypothetical protein